MQLKIYLLIVLALGGLISGCATNLSSSGLMVKPADSSMVENCIFLGDVQGSSGWGGLAASQGMKNSRNEAQESAAQLGATHIVWANISGGYVPSAFGKAYKCK